MITKRNFRSWLTGFLVSVFLPVAALAEQGDHNPTGVAGAFNGQITTGGSYDPYTGNMKRQIDDIVVPGSIGAYPLKWTRYWNSHTSFRDNSLVGAHWRFSYFDYYYSTSCLPGDAGNPPSFPDGRQIIKDAFGIEETHDAIATADLSKYGITNPLHVGEIIHLADGGQVILEGVPTGNCAVHYHAIQIRDPYQTTDPNLKRGVKTTAGCIPFTLTRVIAHEFGHAIMGAHDDGPNKMNNVLQNENPIMQDPLIGEPERIEYAQPCF